MFNDSFTQRMLTMLLFVITKSYFAQKNFFVSENKGQDLEDPCLECLSLEFRNEKQILIHRKCGLMVQGRMDSLAQLKTQFFVYATLRKYVFLIFLFGCACTIKIHPVFEFEHQIRKTNKDMDKKPILARSSGRFGF